MVHPTFFSTFRSYLFGLRDPGHMLVRSRGMPRRRFHGSVCPRLLLGALLDARKAVDASICLPPSVFACDSSSPNPPIIFLISFTTYDFEKPHKVRPFLCNTSTIVA